MTKLYSPEEPERIPTANEVEAFYAIHPGEMLRDEIDSRGLTVAALAEELEVPQKELQAMFDGQSPLTTELALLLCAKLHVDAKPFLSIQMEYDLRTTRRNPSFLARLRKIAAL